jgi:hypothetical protein
LVPPPPPELAANCTLLHDQLGNIDVKPMR